MAITSIKTGSSFKNLTKYNDFLANNAPYVPSAYESISSTVVGAGGAANVTFSSIPQTYKHLQVRFNLRVASSNTQDEMYLTLNGVGSSNANHNLWATGSNVTPQALTYTSVIYIGKSIGGTGTSDVFTGGIIDVHDYTSTTKYKTIRTFSGYDANGSGDLQLTSGFNYSDLTALTSLSIRSNSNLAQNTTVALYGIKGA